MCEIFNISRAGYYAWRKRPECARTGKNVALMVHIKTKYAKSRETYGSPRIYDALKKDGVLCSENRVARLMRLKGIKSVHCKRFRAFATDSNHEYPVADNLLDQNFTATGPNQKWVGDITYIWTTEGWLYLATILDLFSRKVIGWATSRSPSAELACRALEMAVFRRGKPTNLVYHSDRGSQYASSDFRSRLNALGITPSMSRRGNCYDNAVAESFFHTLKVELVHRYKFINRADARTMLADYIEEFYNTNRAHSTLGNCSPVDFEANFKSVV
jgi:putative transposase